MKTICLVLFTFCSLVASQDAKNRTANDFIQELSNLAARQRFRPEYDYPDYPAYADYDYPNGRPIRKRPPTGPYPQDYPYPPYGDYPGPYNDGPLSALSTALGSIARYDDQHCVPRLLCEVAAGTNPSGRQGFYQSALPSFLSMDSLFTLLSAFAGEQAFPYLMFGRAALLGATSQGNPSSCRYAYPECPRDPDRLVDYLNNHNGGFFRFFNGVQQQSELGQQQGSFNFPQEPGSQGQNQNGPNQKYPNYQQNVGQYPNYQQGSGQYPDYQNIGQYPNYQQRPGQYPNYQDAGQYPNYQQGLGQYPNYQQRPQYPNYPQSTDKYPNYQRPDKYGYYQQRPGKYPNYQGSFRPDNPYYQDQYQQNYANRYPYRPSKYRPGYESPNDYQYKSNGTVEAESRILTKPIYTNQNDLYIAQSYHDPKIIRKEKAWRFPEESNIIRDEPIQKDHLIFPSGTRVKKPKSLFFPNDQNEDLYFPTPLPFYDHSKTIFPDRTGTGNLKFDADRLNSQTRDYYQNYHDQEYQPSKKTLIYIVRGNGDPSKPEIVQGRGLEGEEVKRSEESGRNGIPWTFPSPYQGVTYNDRSITVGE